jgi:hypothetical protein
VHCYREQRFIFAWRLKCCSRWTEELLLCWLKVLMHFILILICCFSVILMGHNCSLYRHYCKSCQRMTQVSKNKMTIFQMYRSEIGWTFRLLLVFFTHWCFVYRIMHVTVMSHNRDDYRKKELKLEKLCFIMF